METFKIILKIATVIACIVFSTSLITNIVKLQQLRNEGKALQTQMDELEILCGQA